MSGDASLHYFAYGSNLWWPRFKGRIPSAQPLGTAALHGFALQFRKIGADGSAKADLCFSGRPEHAAYGMLYSIAARHLPLLDRIEGGYHRASVHLECAGTALWALTYLASEPAARPFAPFDWYRELLLAGGRDAGLPGRYLQQVATVATVADPDRERRARNWPAP